MRVAELQMYRETAFERDGRHSNENAPRVYLQRPLSQAEADVADLHTIIIMSFPRRSCTAQSKSYKYGSSSDDDDEQGVVDLSDQDFENDESNSHEDSSDDGQDPIASSSRSPNFRGATEERQEHHVQDPARRLDFDGSDGSPGAGSSSASRALYSSSEEEDARASRNRR